MKKTLLPVLLLVWVLTFLGGGAASAPDRALLDAAYAGDRPQLAAAARLLTDLGSFKFLLPVTVIAAAWLAWRGRRRGALMFLAVTLGGRLAIELQKDLIARLRPDLHEPLVQVASLSFPSGHAANATLVYGAIAFLLGGRPGWIAAAALLAVAIGISRVMLGVHWPSDVIGGWAFGLAWLLAASRLPGFSRA